MKLRFMPNQTDPNQPANQSPIPVISPSADLPPLPPDFSTASPTPVTQMPTTAVTTPEPSIPESGNLPPIITPSPKKKFGGGRIIATILGILLLVGGVGAGILLTQQKQLIPQKAYTSSTTTDKCSLVQVGVTENPHCGDLSCQCDSGGCNCDNKASNNIGTSYSTTYTLTNLTGQSHTISITKNTNYCQTGRGELSGAFAGSCTLNPDVSSDTITLAANQSQTITLTRNGLLGQNKNGDTVSCGTYQTDLSINAVDGNSGCNGNWGPLAGFGLCRTGLDCSGTPPPVPTPSPSPSPTPTTAAACVAVKPYSSTWVALTNTTVSELKTGDVVNFCVSGASGTIGTSGSFGTFDKAQFKIGTTVEPETTTKRPSSEDFCQTYTILPTDTNVTVLAKIHNTPIGWVGETF